MGFLCAVPRVITEKVHNFNLRSSEDEFLDEQQDMTGDLKKGQRMIQITTHDLKDFFTNVSRRRFCEDIQGIIRDIKQQHPGVRFF